MTKVLPSTNGPYWEPRASVKVQSWFAVSTPLIRKDKLETELQSSMPSLSGGKTAIKVERGQIGMKLVVKKGPG